MTDKPDMVDLPVAASPTATSRSAAEEQFDQLIAAVVDYAVFLLDPGGHVLTWNAGAERTNGYTAAEIVGEHFSRLFTEDDRRRGLPAAELEETARTGRFEREAWRLRKDGSRFWADVTVTALRYPTGQLRGFLKIIRDRTEQRAAEQALRESEERLRLMIENVKDYAIFMLDPQGRIVTWNIGAQRIKGYSAGEIIGKHFQIFYPPDVVERGWPAYELKTAAEVGSFEDEGWRIRKDGSRFWANVVITALFDERRQLRGFAKVTRDLTERQQSEERLRLLQRAEEAREQAERANRAKDIFLASISHELRTPLSPIIAWTGLLLERRLDDTQARRALETIQRNARAQARLVEDLLDMSRIVSGKLRLAVRPVSLTSVIEDAIESVHHAAEAKNIRLTPVLDSDTAMVSGDPDRLQQAVWNLLSNAIKFTPKEGHVQIVLERVNSHVEIAVSDSGPGIDPEALPQLFDRFYQADQSTTRSHGGLGLGLAITRHIVELHGGSVHADNHAGGSGAVFTIKLPLMVARTAGESARRHPQQFDTQQQASADLRSVRALVVDDEPDSNEVVRTILTSCGAEVRTAASVAQAMDILGRWSPDVVISDIGMPEADGYELIRQLRAHPTRQQITAIALTAYASSADRVRMLSAGFQMHIAKPVDPGELAAAVSSLLLRIGDRRQ